MLDGCLVVANDPHLLVAFTALGPLVVLELGDQLLVLSGNQPQLILQLLVTLPQQFHLFCHRPHVLVGFGLLLLLKRLYPFQESVCVLCLLLQLVLQLLVQLL